MSDSDAQPAKFLVIGIGASAGGLEAFQRFFSNLPSEPGMAFVLVQHLDPNHESIMPELLAKHTSMPVQSVVDETPVQPDHVYVIPPNATLTIEAAVLRIQTPLEARGHRTPIDNFFRSLAEDQGETAVCIILSGTGSDGTLGLRAVKEHGGLTIAQSSESAKYDSMPRSAIQTGLVDHVLPVEAIPAVLLDYNRHIGDLREHKGLEGIREEAADNLGTICSLLRRRTGHDFVHYKRSTIVRRIQRRMQVLQLDSVPTYVGRLQRDPEEIDQLFKDLLIGVTHFFREPDAFKALSRKIITGLDTEHRDKQSIRIWVPGCATGEEVYSLAILFMETYGALPQRIPIQIFATDIDDEALSVARHGRYPEAIAAQVTPERLSRFFTKQGSMYQVNKELRDFCIFSTHNLIKDPPFSRLDLISCRNLLIYLELELQQRLIPLFHYALRENGYLFLGSAETVAGHGELFKTIDKKHRLYQAKATLRRQPVDFPLMDLTAQRQLTIGAGRPKDFVRGLIDPMQQLILDHFMPASTIINEDGEVLYFAGPTNRFIGPHEGIPTLNLVELVHKSLRLDLRTAIHKAVKTGARFVRPDLEVPTPQGLQRIHLVVQPLTKESSGPFAVVFQEVGLPMDPATTHPRPPDAASDTYVQHLEHELRATREHLQTTVEELETSNEELKSSNEELLSMNEELQSSNEELHTSKEELQSINEELQTVNSELQHKIDELDASNSDLENLFSSTQIATIFLDRDLRIKKYTPTAAEVFHLLPADLGRPLADLAAHFFEGSIIPDLRAVLETLQSTAKERRITESDRFYLVRLLPYRTLANRIEGVIMTLTDITDRRRIESVIRTRARQQEAIAGFGQFALAESDVQTVYMRSAQVIAATLDVKRVRIFARDKAGQMVVQAQFGEGGRDDVVASAESGRPTLLEWVLSKHIPVSILDMRTEDRFTNFGPQFGEEFVSGMCCPITGPDDQPIGAVLTASSVPRAFTDDDLNFLRAMANILAGAIRRKQDFDTCQESEAKFRATFEQAAAGFGHLSPEGDWILVNDWLCNLLRTPRQELLTKNWKDITDPESLDEEAALWNRMADGKIDHYELEKRLIRKDGGTVWVENTVSAVRACDDGLGYMVAVVQDISIRKHAEEELNRLTNTLEDRVRARTQALAAMASRLTVTEQRERRRLATELHDHLSQLLALAKMRITQISTNQDLQRIDDLAEVIDQALTYSRTLITELSPTALFEQGIRAGLDSLAARMKLQGLDVQIDAPKEELPVLPEDMTILVYEAIRELLFNVLKHVPDRHAYVVIRQRSNNILDITVRDNGPGFDADHIPNDRYGLTSVRERVRTLNGTLSLETSLDSGTTARIKLPLPQAADLKAPHLPDTSVDANSSGTGKRTRVTPSDVIKILIADDHAMVRDGLRSVLEKYSQIQIVGEAQDGEEAVALADGLRPDVVVMDVSMPRMSGIEATKQIRSRHPDIVIIAMSVNADPGTVGATASAGASGFVSKFEAAYKLHEAIQSALQVRDGEDS